MLAALSIRDIVLIERLHIAFGAGLSVLTGETGAGKSILLDSLALGLGARGDASLVRKGAESGEVTALFEPGPNHPVWALLADNGIGAEEGSIILRRVQSADGRTRAFINDRPVSAQLMKAVGASLVEIHGQHDDRALIDPLEHRNLLDAYGGLGDSVDGTREAWIECERLREMLEDHEARAAEAERERDFLGHSLEELDLLAPEDGEEERLADRRQAMMQAEKVAGDLQAALATLDGEGSLLSRLSAVLRKLERQQDQAPQLMTPLVEALARAHDEAGEALHALEAAVQASEFDAGELERVEERLFALRAAARKHGCRVDDLPALHARLREQLAEIEEGGERGARFALEWKQARAAYDLAAERLSKARHEAARTLEKAVAGELAPLKLERAEFMVRLESNTEFAGPAGIDRAEFWVRTNPGAEPGPLRKIASGGELARFILALKVALADRGSAPTLVFDEVDTAVGGAVADAIGQRLARLAGGVQVISVTHAPQVAARAGSHMRITKEDRAAGEAVMVTQVAMLDAPARQEEIARMLSGAEITDEARAQAERLLASGT
jgi:DNA repair protein RecN (Recombination protein N)